MKYSSMISALLASGTKRESLAGGNGGCGRVMAEQAIDLSHVQDGRILLVMVLEGGKSLNR